MKTATLHLMVGLPCSGKTTYARQLKETCKALLFTPDIWHLALFGHDFPSPEHDSRHSQVEGLMWQVAEEALLLGTSVILDFGFWAKEERDFFRDKALELGASFQVHYMDVPMEEIKRRVLIRNEEERNDVFRISLEDIDSWAKFFQPATAEEISTVLNI